MTLRDLVARLSPLMSVTAVDAVSATAWDRAIAAIDYDSRHVVPGAAFVALKGLKADGSAFGVDAATRGAAAIFSESLPSGDVAAPWFVVPDARLALAELAAVFYRHPSDELMVVGVTGTNGKTTTTYLLASILDQGGYKCGRVGTIGYRIGLVERESSRTTPEAPDIQRMLREMVDARCLACAMEVSSHALALRRADRMRFSAALFTNLTRDHLDYHGSMEEYFLAKRRLFEGLAAGTPAVVNVDDQYGQRLKREFPHATTFALDRPADVTISGLSLSLQGLTGTINTPRGSVRLQSALVGRPNAYNILGAAAACAALDLPLHAIEEGITALGSVPGRFQTVSGDGDDVAVVVDYAHTDDALRNLLETARPLTTGRVVTVFGCGGDRDRTKRPLMGMVAARMSDAVVLTSDNPRSEDPLAIIEEIKRGLVQPERPLVHHGHAVAPVKSVPWVSLPDRREAIEHAIREAQPGDLVLVAGKGHEKTQTIGDRVVPFDDVAVAREALARRRAKGNA